MAQAYPQPARRTASGFQPPRAANDNLPRFVRPRPMVAANDNFRALRDVVEVVETVRRPARFARGTWLNLAFEVGATVLQQWLPVPEAWTSASGWELASYCPSPGGTGDPMAFGPRWTRQSWQFGDPPDAMCLGGQAVGDPIPSDARPQAAGNFWFWSYWKRQSGTLGQPNFRATFVRSYAAHRYYPGTEWPEPKPAFRPGSFAPVVDFPPGPRVVQRGHQVAIRPALASNPKPPPRGTRERKLTLRSAGGVALQLAEGVTETLDVVDAFWWALPKRFRRGKTPQGKAWDLYLHFRDVDLAKAMANLARNELTDRAIGRISRYVNRHGRLYDTHGVFVGPAL